MSSKRQRQTYESSDYDLAQYSATYAYNTSTSTGIPLNTSLQSQSHSHPHPPPSSSFPYPLSPTSSEDHAPKHARTISSSTSSSSASRPIICTLPPTCNPPHNRPVELANAKELEIHYGKYHAHVCQAPRCAKIFPDERLLELHLIECHDPLAEVRKERGEKIFACFLPSCKRFFSTPKTRRLHLIEAHNYPKQYFFAITNKGMGGLLTKWGEGASLLRGEWKARERTDNDMDTDKEGEGDDEGTQTAETTPEPMPVEPAITESVKNKAKVTVDEVIKRVEHQLQSQSHSNFNRGGRTPSNNSALPKKPDPVENLTSAMDALAFVPTKIRFGRAGKTGRLLGKQPASVSRTVAVAPATGSTQAPIMDSEMRDVAASSSVAVPTGTNEASTTSHPAKNGGHSRGPSVTLGSSVGSQVPVPASATPSKSNNGPAPASATHFEPSINIDAALKALEEDEPWRSKSTPESLSLAGSPEPKVEANNNAGIGARGGGRGAISRGRGRGGRGRGRVSGRGMGMGRGSNFR